MLHNLVYITGYIMLALMMGCSEVPFDQVLKESDKPTSEIVNEFADCYQSLEVQADLYMLGFDKSCIDDLITNDIDEPIYQVSVADIEKNPVYVGKLVEVNAYVMLLL